MTDPEAIDCPRAKTWMTPCVARDGRTACADDGMCVGCGTSPDEILADLAQRYEPARSYWRSRQQSHGPGQTVRPYIVADRLARLVAEYVNREQT